MCVTRRAFVRTAAAVLALTVIGAFATTMLAMRNQERTQGASQAAAVERLFAVTLDDADGRSQTLAQWRGRTLVVNFWATWCAPCVAEMPDLDRLQRRYADQNVMIVGIGIDNLERVRAFRDRLGLRMPLLAGGYESLALARAFGDNQGVLPYTAVLSTKGELTHSQVGALEPGQLETWLAKSP